MLDEMLENVAVRIEDVSGNPLGSGVIWVPQLKSEYAYVFTAAHVVTQKDIVIRCLENDYSQGKTLTYAPKSDIVCHSGYSNKMNELENDVAVIRVRQEKWMTELPKLVFGQPFRNIDIRGRGFPGNASDKIFLLAGHMLQGHIGNSLREIKRFHINLDMQINQSFRGGELAGFSGTGIFDQNRSQEELVLLGIFSYGQGVDAALATTNAFSADLIKEICESNNWDTPEYDTAAPLSFDPYVMQAIKSLTTQSVKDEIYENTQDIISNDIKPINLIQKINDYHDIPKCNSNRMRCRKHWVAMLQHLSVINILGVETANFRKPSIKMVDNGEEVDLPIEFICSEGHDGDGSIDALVHSLIICEYTKGTTLRDKGIVIWASNDAPGKKLYKRSKYNKIVASICHEQKGESRRMRLDIKYGERPPNNLSIIHINKLLETLDDIDKDNCTREDIKHCVKELFTNVIS